MKCRGWTFHKKGDLNKLQYRKLENVFDELAPNGEAGKFQDWVVRVE
jgi:hypothetical protein